MPRGGYTLYLFVQALEFTLSNGPTLTTSTTPIQSTFVSTQDTRSVLTAARWCFPHRLVFVTVYHSESSGKTEKKTPKRLISYHGLMWLDNQRFGLGNTIKPRPYFRKGLKWAQGTFDMGEAPCLASTLNGVVLALPVRVTASARGQHTRNTGAYATRFRPERGLNAFIVNATLTRTHGRSRPARPRTSHWGLGLEACSRIKFSAIKRKEAF
jgi:hypothetical protein